MVGLVEVGLKPGLGFVDLLGLRWPDGLAGSLEFGFVGLMLGGSGSNGIFGGVVVGFIRPDSGTSVDGHSGPVIGFIVPDGSDGPSEEGLSGPVFGFRGPGESIGSLEVGLWGLMLGGIGLDGLGRSLGVMLGGIGPDGIIGLGLCLFGPSGFFSFGERLEGLDLRLSLNPRFKIAYY